MAIRLRVVTSVLFVGLAGCTGDMAAPERDASVRADASASADAARPRDASSNTDAHSPGVDAGMPAADAGPPSGDGGTCVPARQLWFDDFETGDYDRWTSNSYDSDWHERVGAGGCGGNGITTERVHSGSRAQRSYVSCAIGESHRGYGGLQFSGDDRVEAYTNTGAGIDAVHGVVVTYWAYLDVPYSFGDGRWFSPMTMQSKCDWSENVLTLGIEDASNRLTPAHVRSTGGEYEFEPGASGFPLREWVRVTVYVNFRAGVLHVWQNGESLVHATFSRPTQTICQWHWGLYASPDNYDIEYLEDDMSLWKLEAAWSDFDVEPYLGVAVPVCSD